MTKKSKLPITIISAIVLILIVGTYFYFDYSRSISKPYSDTEQLVELEISEGQSTKQIAANLQEVGLVKYSMYFEFYVRQNELAQSIQAGRFSIPGNATIKEIAEILQVAYEQDVWVTIPEGYRITEIADVLGEEFAEVEEPLFDKDEFLSLTQTNCPTTDVGIEIPAGKSCEGFLFPDTYRFAPDSTSQLVLYTMMRNFKTRVVEKYSSDIENFDYTLYEIVTLASIVEREAIFEDDRPMVADILMRRLEASWALEVDVSLLYYFDDWKRELSSEDLQVDTPYNTRLYQGLTPTPICNPGVDTIISVLEPTPNSEWFFISDSEGDLHYGKTLDEHNVNIQQYLSQ